MSKKNQHPIDYQAILESSPDLYLILDPDLNIVDVSNAYLKATMVKRDEIIGRLIFDVFPDNPNDAMATGVKNLSESLNRVLTNKTADTMAVQKYDVRNPESKDGQFEERYWSPINSPVLDKNNNVKYIIHRVEDVTKYVLLKKSDTEQLKIMEELRTYVGKMEIEIFQRAQEIQDANKELRAQQEKLNLALQASGTGTWLWDIVHDDIIVDDYMSALFGFQDKHAFPKKVADFFKLLHPDDKERVSQEIKKSIDDHTLAYNVEYRTLWPDNSEHMITARGLVYVDEKNTPIKMAGVCLDITEKVHSKRELEKLANELSAINKKLLASNEQLQQFAYVASHDLQEPLRMVGSYVQLIQNRYRGKLDKDADEFINFAVDGAERMKALINDLLIYARIETQGKPFKDISMQDALNWALANLQSAIAESNAKIIAGELPIVFGDLIQLGQLYQNLIKNALNYRNRTTDPEIHIDVINEKDQWKIAVRDNGIGIEQQYFDRIFGIFQRLHTNEQYKGTGIGLAVCKRIVERHGGKIWVDSTLNQGSTFYFTLPKDRSSHYAS